jgi:hypothetical protein
MVDRGLISGKTEDSLAIRQGRTGMLCLGPLDLDLAARSETVREI